VQVGVQRVGSIQGVHINDFRRMHAQALKSFVAL
jgi:hypothetical protein